MLTFLHNTPPFPGPVTQLLGIALLNLGPLLEAADQLIAQFVAIVNAFHRPLVVPRLTNKSHVRVISFLNLTDPVLKFNSLTH